LNASYGRIPSRPPVRLISSQLYGVSARDPVTFAAIGGPLLAVALAASGIPALRAARIDPMAALRAE
jgi:putative ABC transport system permease protein